MATIHAEIGWLDEAGGEPWAGQLGECGGAERQRDARGGR